MNTHPLTGLAFDASGWLNATRRVESANFDVRPTDTRVELVVLHNISLPPGEFGGPGIIELFSNRLDPAAHLFYAQIKGLRVSAHFLIRRDGELIQFVSCQQRAWHAGVSSWQGRERCNDFSIGIELEGTDHLPFAACQYDTLDSLLVTLFQCYPIVAVVGHSDIAPGRKTDPGPFFDWSRVRRPGPEFRNRSV